MPPPAERPEGHAPGEPSPVLLRAVRRVLRSLVRLLIAQGITYPALTALLKGVYVRVAVDDFELAGKALTDSRVSVLTGVHRKDVRRLRQTPEASQAPSRGVSLGTQVVAHWLADETFSDASGRPLPLPRRKAPGAPSFELLVEVVSRGDVKARSVLDELQRLGIASVDADDQVTLNVEGFVPGDGFDEKAYYFGRILSAHVDAAASNVSGRDNPFFDRAVFYADLREEDVERLEKMCRQLGADALTKVNAEAHRLKRRAGGTTDDARRICFGVFFHSAPTDVVRENHDADEHAAEARRAG